MHLPIISLFLVLLLFPFLFLFRLLLLFVIPFYLFSYPYSRFLPLVVNRRFCFSVSKLKVILTSSILILPNCSFLSFILTLRLRILHLSFYLCWFLHCTIISFCICVQFNFLSPYYFPVLTFFRYLSSHFDFPNL